MYIEKLSTTFTIKFFVSNKYNVLKWHFTEKKKHFNENLQYISISQLKIDLCKIKFVHIIEI
jgi:hypothetical protein